eukprot:scaffold54693_cov34-Phaeocystis_antarctica.AAC.1
MAPGAPLHGRRQEAWAPARYAQAASGRPHPQRESSGYVPPAVTATANLCRYQGELRPSKS